MNPETTAMLRKAYEDNTMSQNIVYYWHKMFRRFTRSSTSHSNQNLKKSRDMLNFDRHLGVSE